MPTRQEKWFVFVLAVVFALLFHRQPIGLNLLLFEVVTLVWFHFRKRISFKHFNVTAVYVGLLVSAVAVVVSYSTFAIVINMLTYVLFVGVTLYPQIKSLPNAWGMAFENIFRAPVLYFSRTDKANKKRGFWAYLWRFRIFVIPALIIIIFLAVYSGSNPVFNDLRVYVGEHITDVLDFIFGRVDGWILFTWLLGMLIAMFSVMHHLNQKRADRDKNAPQTLERVRIRRRRKFNPAALKNELKAAIFLLFTLNAMILVLNAIDIYWVWFNFEWNGDFLKRFVHEGTYLLILSIIISIVIVLYFFRGNLNHFKKNKFLRTLSYIWMAQNAVLVVSVAIRNYWYIHYFSLAYKRIGIFVFLLLTLVGIVTVIIKVMRKKSGSYLVRVNAFALFAVLVACTVPDWDVFIAKYNFRHSDTAFVHLDFLSGLSDKALPYLHKTPEELAQINYSQEAKFSFSRDKALYMTPDEYRNVINYRKTDFIRKWENKSWLSWNLPEYLAYRKLKGEF